MALGKIIEIRDVGSYFKFNLISLESAGTAQWGPVGFSASTCSVGTQWCSGNASASIEHLDGSNCTSCYQSSSENFPSVNIAVNYAPSGASETKGHWKLPGAKHCEMVSSSYSSFWTAIAYGGNDDKAWYCTKGGGYLLSTSRSQSYAIYPVLYFRTYADCGGYCPTVSYL